MRYKYILSVFLLNISLYFMSTRSKDLFVSNENVENEYPSNNTAENPYTNLIKALLDNTENTTDINITILNNKFPYIIDVVLSLALNLYIHTPKNEKIISLIEFTNEGCFKLQGNYSFTFENIKFHINTKAYFPYVVFSLEDLFKIFFNV